MSKKVNKKNVEKLKLYLQQVEAKKEKNDGRNLQNSKPQR